jgi:hypothetical protein
VAAGSRLVQIGELHVSVTEFQTDGVRLGTGSTWLQLGSTTITAGQPGAHDDFALGSSSYLSAFAALKSINEAWCLQHVTYSPPNQPTV